MILGTGVDLCEVARIRSAIERHGPRFIQRIYTEREIAYVERKANRFERYAARFAAKEAGMKAIGTGWRGGVRWRDFEVANLPSGKPTLAFHGKAAEVAARLGVAGVALSMTHTAEQGMAMVIVEGRQSHDREGVVWRPELPEKELADVRQFVDDLKTGSEGEQSLSAETLAAIQEGLEDIKAGRTRSWEQVKRENGL